jgi:predicted nucleic acid-binding protein
LNESIFLDTSGWLAAISPRDTHHQQAVAAYDGYSSTRTLFVTSNLVIAEMHALTVRERGARAGCDLIDAIYMDPLYRIIPVDRDLESRAVDNWLRRFTESRFSLTDAVSFQIMKDQHITEALALDHHFVIAGFRTVPSSGSTVSREPKRKR